MAQPAGIPSFQQPDATPFYDPCPYLIARNGLRNTMRHELTHQYLDAITQPLCPNSHLHPGVFVDMSPDSLTAKRNAIQVGDDSVLLRNLTLDQKRRCILQDIEPLLPHERSWHQHLHSPAWDLLQLHPALVQQQQPPARYELQVRDVPFAPALNTWHSELVFVEKLKHTTLCQVNHLLSLFAEAQQNQQSQQAVPQMEVVRLELECETEGLDSTQEQWMPDVYAIVRRTLPHGEDGDPSHEVVAILEAKMWCNRSFLRYCKDTSGAPLMGDNVSHFENSRFHLLNQVGAHCVVTGAPLAILYNGEDMIVFERRGNHAMNPINQSTTCTLRPWAVGFGHPGPQTIDGPSGGQADADFLVVNPTWLFFCLSVYSATLARFQPLERPSRRLQ